MIGKQMVGKFRSMALCVLVLLVACPATAFALVGPVDVESDGWNENPYIAYTLAPDQFTAALNFFRVDADQLNTAQRDYLAGDSAWWAFQSSIEENNDFGVALLAFPFYQKGPDELLYEVNVDGSVYGHAQSVLREVMRGSVSVPGLDVSDHTISGQADPVFTTLDKLPTSITSYTRNVGGLTDKARPDTWYVLTSPIPTGLVDGSYFEEMTQPVQFTVTVSNNIDMADYEPVCYFFASHTSNNWISYSIYLFRKGHYTITESSYTGTLGDATYMQPVYAFHTDEPFYKLGTSSYTRLGAYSGGEINVPLGNQSFTQITDVTDGEIGYTSVGSSTNQHYNGFFYARPEVITTIPTTPDPSPQPPVQPPDPGTDVPTVDPPTWPTIDFPDITIHGAPITITWPTISADADYTELLKQIIKRLEKIGDVCADIVNDMDEHCQHLQQAIKDAAEYIVDNLELGIDPDLDDLVRGIDTAWRKVTQTIKEQVKWLADQLDYDFTVTLDLDKIEQYLRRIISKMGGGTSKPDPTTDPFSWGDWLNDLWTKIFTALQIALPDELGELLELFDILKTKFPFSVPFDLIAIVALFDHAPVTPVFELPYPMLLATGAGYDTVTIDCSGWDSTMVMVRDLEVVLFTAYLISRTQWAMDSINPKKGK